MLHPETARAVEQWLLPLSDQDIRRPEQSST
jgi:hypothetical protein